MDVNALFHWLLPSPGYLLLVLAGFLFLVGLVFGLTDSNLPAEVDASSPKQEMGPPANRWWQHDEEHYREWNDHQARELHRSAGKDSSFQ